MKEKKAKRSSGGISWIFGYLGFGVGAIGMDLSYGLFNSFLTKYLTDVLLLNATFLLIVPTLTSISSAVKSRNSNIMLPPDLSRTSPIQPRCPVPTGPRRRTAQDSWGRPSRVVRPSISVVSTSPLTRLLLTRGLASMRGSVRASSRGRRR